MTLQNIDCAMQIIGIKLHLQEIANKRRLGLGNRRLPWHYFAL